MVEDEQSGRGITGVGYTHFYSPWVHRGSQPHFTSKVAELVLITLLFCVDINVTVFKGEMQAKLDPSKAQSPYALKL